MANAFNSISFRQVYAIGLKTWIAQAPAQVGRAARAFFISLGLHLHLTLTHYWRARRALLCPGYLLPFINPGA